MPSTESVADRLRLQIVASIARAIESLVKLAHKFAPSVPEGATELNVVIGPVSDIPTQGSRTMKTLQLKDNQQVRLSIDPSKIKDAAGNPAPIDGAPSWVGDRSDLVTLTPSGDGLSCLVKRVGPLGKATLTASADADMGSGVEQITDVIEVEIVASNATSLEIEAGEPEPAVD